MERDTFGLWYPDVFKETANDSTVDFNPMQICEHSFVKNKQNKTNEGDQHKAVITVIKLKYVQITCLSSTDEDSPSVFVENKDPDARILACRRMKSRFID